MLTPASNLPDLTALEYHVMSILPSLEWTTNLSGDELLHLVSAATKFIYQFRMVSVQSIGPTGALELMRALSSYLKRSYAELDCCGPQVPKV